MKKKKQFYTHLVSFDSVYLELQTLEMTDKQRSHLITLIDSHLHVTILDHVLQYLSTDEKNIFLEYLDLNLHENAWDILKKKETNIEEKIKLLIEEVKQEFINDIHEIKNK